MSFPASQYSYDDPLGIGPTTTGHQETIPIGVAAARAKAALAAQNAKSPPKKKLDSTPTPASVQPNFTPPPKIQSKAQASSGTLEGAMATLDEQYGKQSAYQANRDTIKYRLQSLLKRSEVASQVSRGVPLLDAADAFLPKYRSEVNADAAVRDLPKNAYEATPQWAKTGIGVGAEVLGSLGRGGTPQANAAAQQALFNRSEDQARSDWEAAGKQAYGFAARPAQLGSTFHDMPGQLTNAILGMFTGDSGLRDVGNAVIPGDPRLQTDDYQKGAGIFDMAATVAGGLHGAHSLGHSHVSLEDPLGVGTEPTPTAPEVPQAPAPTVKPTKSKVKVTAPNPVEAKAVADGLMADGHDVTQTLNPDHTITVEGVKTHSQTGDAGGTSQRGAQRPQGAKFDSVGYAEYSPLKDDSEVRKLFRYETEDGNPNDHNIIEQAADQALYDITKQNGGRSHFSLQEYSDLAAHLRDIANDFGADWHGSIIDHTEKASQELIDLVKPSQPTKSPVTPPSEKPSVAAGEGVRTGAAVPPEPVIRDPELASIHSPDSRPPSDVDVQFFRQGKPDKNGLYPNMRAYLSEESTKAYQAHMDGSTAGSPVVLDVPGDGKFTLNPESLPEFHKLITGQPIQFEASGKTYQTTAHGPQGTKEVGGLDTPDTTFKVADTDQFGRPIKKSLKGTLLPDRPEFEGEQFVAVKRKREHVVYNVRTGKVVTSTFAADSPGAVADAVVATMKDKGVSIGDVLAGHDTVNPEKVSPKGYEPPQYTGERPSQSTEQTTTQTPAPEPAATPQSQGAPTAVPPTEPPTQGADAFRQQVRDSLDKYGVAGVDNAGDFGVSREDALKIAAEEKAKGSKPTLDDTLAAHEQDVRDALDTLNGKPGVRGGREAGATLNPAQALRTIGLHLKLAAIQAARAGIGYAAWTKNMFQRFGPNIGPHLAEAWAKVKDVGHSINDAVGGNLSKLRSVSEPIALAAQRFAGARNFGVGLYGIADNLIDAAAGEKGFWRDKLYPALAQTRITALKARLSKMSGEIRGMTDAEFEARYHGSHYESSVGTIGGKNTVDTLLESGHVSEARHAAADSLEGGAQTQNDVMSPTDVAKVEAHPGFKAALDAYKTHIEPEIAESHSLNNGVFGTENGKHDTYVPLVREAGVTAPDSGLAYKAPSNQSNRFATGAGDHYTTKPEDVMSRFESQARSNSKANLVNGLQDSGLVRPATPADRAAKPGDLSITLSDGRTVPAILKKVDWTMRVVRDGHSYMQPADNIVIPKWLDSELSPILERAGSSSSVFKGAAHALNQATTLGLTDSILHSRNLISIANSHIPGFSMESLKGLSLHDPAFVKDAIEVAKLGALPTRVTHALLSDGKFHNPVNMAVFGPGGLDVKLRVIMYRQLKRFSPGATPMELYKGVSAFGTYTDGLESAMERSLKGSGIGPFATAGKTKLIGGAKAALGMTPLPNKGVWASLPTRVGLQLRGGAAGYVGAWAVGNKIATGKWPWEDPEAKFGMVRLGKDHYLDLKLVDSAVGAALAPVGDYLDVSKLSGNSGMGLEAAGVRTANTLLEPVLNSPALKLGTRTAFGADPHIVGRGRDGKPGMSLMPLSRTEQPGLDQLKENVLQGIAGINPLTESGLHLVGVAKPAWQVRRDEGKSKLEEVAGALFDTILPGAYREGGNTALKQKELVDTWKAAVGRAARGR